MKHGTCQECHNDFSYPSNRRLAKFCSQFCYVKSRTGKMFPDERKTNIANSLRGKKFSDEHRKKLCGRKPSNYNPDREDQELRSKGGVRSLRKRERLVSSKQGTSEEAGASDLSTVGNSTDATNPEV